MTKEVIEGKYWAGLHRSGEMKRMYFESIRCDDGVYVSPEKRRESIPSLGNSAN